MIKNIKTIIILNNSNVEYYASKGYKIPKNSKFKNTKYGFSRGSTIEVLTSDLPKNSRAKIIHICEKCLSEREYSYRDAINLKYCKKCSVSGDKNPMFKKMVIPKQQRVNNLSTKPCLTPEERLNRKIQRSILRSSYRKVYDVLKGKRNKSDIYKYLGCTYEEFKTYIESKFQDGMNWGNWSKTGWHLDHVIPLEKLDPTNIEDFKKSCHYTNFQPMWAYNNCAKRSSLPEVIVLAGCFGSGKSWVAAQLGTKFHIVDYDSDKKYQPTNPIDFKKPTLLMLPIKVSTFVKDYQDKVIVKLVVIQESEETIVSRILRRNGNVNLKTIKGRIRRMKALSKMATFSGTSLEVLKYLK